MRITKVKSYNKNPSQFSDKIKYKGGICKMTITHKGKVLQVTGETTIFYICKLVKGNEETIYVPKDEVIIN